MVLAQFQFAGKCETMTTLTLFLTKKRYAEKWGFRRPTANPDEQLKFPINNRSVGFIASTSDQYSANAPYVGVIWAHFIVCRNEFSS